MFIFCSLFFCFCLFGFFVFCFLRSVIFHLQGRRCRSANPAPADVRRMAQPLEYPAWFGHFIRKWMPSSAVLLLFQLIRV